MQVLLQVLARLRKPFNRVRSYSWGSHSCPIAKKGNPFDYQ